MKLVKIKLINWHIFRNHTIDVKGNILITGENACGKSTLMDAIYFVISGGDYKHFNKAANESGERTVESYLRGKLGLDKKPYLRDGANLIGYVILQFENDINQSLSLGCALEIVDGTPVKVHFFVVDNYCINDADLIVDKKVVDHRIFRKNVEQKNYVYTKLSDVVRDRKRTIGRDIFKITDYQRFFELLQNAISFKPISEVSSFVNGFLLKDNPILLDSLKQEIRSYQDINRMLQKEEEKLNLLEPFVPKAEKYVENIKVLNYLEVIKNQSKVYNINSEIKHNNTKLNHIVNEISESDEQISNLEEKESIIKNDIYKYENNEEYRALLDKKRRLESYKENLKQKEKELKYYKELIIAEGNIAKKLKIESNMLKTVQDKDYSNFKISSVSLKEKLEKLNEELYKKEAFLNVEKEKNVEERKKLKFEYEELKKGIPNYPKAVKALIDICNNAIRNSFPKDKDIFVRPLCEYLEINDKRWTNAIEGYLNSQKFNLIVDYKYYDCVSKEYERLKDKLNVYGVGIVNFNGVKSNKMVNNSLLSKLNLIENKIAAKYAESILGQVQCCDKVEDLKHTEIGITPTVMIYKNGVLRAARPESYEKPFIGKASIKVRINKLEHDIECSINKYKNIEANLKEIKDLKEIISQSRIDEIIKMDNLWLFIDNYIADIEELEKEIFEEEKESGLLDIVNMLASLRKKLSSVITSIKDYNQRRDGLLREQGNYEKIIKDLVGEQEIFNKKYNEAFDKIVDKDEYLEFTKKYQNSNKYDDTLINSDYDSAKYSNNATKEKLIKVMTEYTTRFRPSFTATIENIKDYINEYYQLKNRGVIEYKEQAKLAYERAEKSFKEDFIVKLNSNIDTAIKTLKRINKNLSNHLFGTDGEKYEFIYKPTGVDEFANYYRIITSGKLLETEDLFTEILSEGDAIIMKELFDKISQESNSNEAEKELQKYLDYRNYMSYDIKITNQNNSVSYFSKINKEKSGGETQTPFYIVIASCFDELLDKEKDSTSIVVFDEAFNNMDEGRIKALMEFYSNLNIQIIIIVPSIRMHTISNYMDTVIGISKNKTTNYPHIIKMGEKI